MRLDASMGLVLRSSALSGSGLGPKRRTVGRAQRAEPQLPQHVTSHNLGLACTEFRSKKKALQSLNHDA